MPFIDTNKLKRELEGVKKEMRETTSAALARENATMTDAEAQRYTDLETQKREIEAKIQTAERNNQLEADDALARAAEGQHEPEIPPEAKRFQDIGEMARAVFNACTGRGVDNRLQESRAATGMGEDIGSAGGYLVETTLLAEIMKKMYTQSILAGRCRRIPIGPNANGIAWREVDETSRANGYRWGGINSQWVDSGTAVTASKLKFAKKKMDLEKLMAVVPVTDELLQDSSALGSLLDQAVTEDFAFMVDDAIVSGTGAGMPLGVLNADATISVAKESGQLADTIVYENIVAMRARMPYRNRANSIWTINQDAEPQLQTMAFNVGTGGVPVYMPAAGVSGAPYDTLFGRPVFPIEQAKTVGDVGDISLLDLSQYLLIDKGGVKRDVSMHIYFLRDETAFRFILRVNGMPLWSSAVTPANGTNTISPFITLAERA